MTTAQLLTPPGTAAIASIAVEGPAAREIVQRLFSRPVPEVRRFRFGQLAGDDVIVAAIAENRIEIHCHGGVRMVRTILDALMAGGCVEDGTPTCGHDWALVGRARTLRTAGILLDQSLGAFTSAVQCIMLDPILTGLDALAAVVPVSSHLVEPWIIAIAGAPNAGKSSLKNALVGYERAIVSPVAGTTRDAVRTLAAFDGWPVELIDTAGLRASADPLEAAGVDLARCAIDSADVLLWVHDATLPLTIECPRPPDLVVVNKRDLPDVVIPPGSVAVSAKTGEGIPGLIDRLVRTLVPVALPPGAAVPVTPEHCAIVLEAGRLATAGKLDAARQVLAKCVSNVADWN